MSRLKELTDIFDKDSKPILNPLDFEYRKRNQQHRSAVAKNEAIMAARYNLVLRAAELEKQSKLTSKTQREQYRASVRTTAQRYVPSFRVNSPQYGGSGSRVARDASRVTSKMLNPAAKSNQTDDHEVNRAVLSMYLQATNPPWVGRVDQMLSKFQGSEQVLFRSVAKGNIPDGLKTKKSFNKTLVPNSGVGFGGHPAPLKPTLSSNAVNVTAKGSPPTASSVLRNKVPPKLLSYKSSPTFGSHAVSKRTLVTKPSTKAPKSHMLSKSSVRMDRRPAAHTEPTVGLDDHSDSGSSSASTASSSPEVATRQSVRMSWHPRMFLGGLKMNRNSMKSSANTAADDSSVVSSPPTTNLGWARRTINRMSVFGARLAAIKLEVARERQNESVGFNKSTNLAVGVKESPFMRFDRKQMVTKENGTMSKERPDVGTKQFKTGLGSDHPRVTGSKLFNGEQAKGNRARRQQEEMQGRADFESSGDKLEKKYTAPKQRGPGRSHRRNLSLQPPRLRKGTGSGYISGPFDGTKSKLAIPSRSKHTLRGRKKLNVDPAIPGVAGKPRTVRRKRASMPPPQRGLKQKEEPNQERETIESILRTFFEVYAPDRVPKLGQLMLTYRGNETELFDILEVEYGVRFGPEGYVEIPPEEMELQTNLTEFLVAADEEPDGKATLKANKLMKRYTIRNLANALMTRYQTLPDGWKEKLST